MTQALAQNATDLAISTPKDIDLVEMVMRNATRAIKNPLNNAKRESLMLNNTKLLNLCRMEWRSKNGGVGRVPDEIDNILQSNVSDFILSNINRVNPSNALTFTVRDVLDFRNLAIVEKVTAIGQNTLLLQNQLEAANRLIRECNDKISLYQTRMASGNSGKDYTELLKNANKRLAELNLTKHHIQSTIEETKKAVK